MDMKIDAIEPCSKELYYQNKDKKRKSKLKKKTKNKNWKQNLKSETKFEIRI